MGPGDQSHKPGRAVLRDLAGFIEDPIYHIAALLVIAILIQSARKFLLFVSLLTLSLATFTNLPDGVLGWLEKQYQPVSFNTPSDTKPTESVAQKQAAVVLGGAGLYFNRATSQFQFSPAAARAFTSLQLLNEKKIQKIFFVGGDIAIPRDCESESQSFLLLARRAGVRDDQIVIESQSKNTLENVRNLEQMPEFKPITDFYLVTSAFHMRRSMQLFARTSKSPVPFPVDYRATLPESTFVEEAKPSAGTAAGAGILMNEPKVLESAQSFLKSFHFAWRLQGVDGILKMRLFYHELIGMLAYRMIEFTD